MLLNALIILAADPKQGGTVQLIMMGAIILVFWLFMIRPQAKKAKEQKKFIDNLSKGDKIVTIAGIHGVVNKINEDGTLQLEVTPGSYLKIEKSALSMEWTAAINKPVAEEKK
ncbi:preprotein translocase subunit YajC [Sediminibacterium sp.]|jgi:preprotein translocase subunit YajC|uniref:preprotein translocase subunit YajC n=1 Tax=Sediminibacterium sp. TaxID=1917865 RepID=UPI001B410A96|nr:preprotein translocase subunit YajC [Sediminibacterium sp.]MBP7346892.1 preprotein translocase subunit YajC [Sediminibacterium sp.]MDO8995443.1 preprotein translocase subunit YajC [Sediminibacterium sp.]MDO9156423.1 preprotein translocase subunit YajC [Sediminibacterium sp.]MDP1972764.1 preprotein translocase subunit YajC [Sediminibacterium sp.]MDP2422005.1 preprotein translocase subunit YajC [Sediminibacterium sp.]